MPSELLGKIIEFHQWLHNASKSKKPDFPKCSLALLNACSQESEAQNDLKLSVLLKTLSVFYEQLFTTEGLLVSEAVFGSFKSVMKDDNNSNAKDLITQFEDDLQKMQNQDLLSLFKKYYSPLKEELKSLQGQGQELSPIFYPARIMSIYISGAVAKKLSEFTEFSTSLYDLFDMLANNPRLVESLSLGEEECVEKVLSVLSQQSDFLGKNENNQCEKLFASSVDAKKFVLAKACAKALVSSKCGLALQGRTYRAVINFVVQTKPGEYAESIGGIIDRSGDPLRLKCSILSAIIGKPQLSDWQEHFLVDVLQGQLAIAGDNKKLLLRTAVQLPFTDDRATLCQEKLLKDLPLPELAYLLQNISFAGKDGQHWQDLFIQDLSKKLGNVSFSTKLSEELVESVGTIFSTVLRFLKQNPDSLGLVGLVNTLLFQLDLSQFPGIGQKAYHVLIDPSLYVKGCLDNLKAVLQIFQLRPELAASLGEIIKNFYQKAIQFDEISDRTLSNAQCSNADFLTIGQCLLFMECLPDLGKTQQESTEKAQSNLKSMLDIFTSTKPARGGPVFAVIARQQNEMFCDLVDRVLALPLPDYAKERTALFNLLATPIEKEVEAGNSPLQIWCLRYLSTPTELVAGAVPASAAATAAAQPPMNLSHLLLKVFEHAKKVNDSKTQVLVVALLESLASAKHPEAYMVLAILEDGKEGTKDAGKIQAWMEAIQNLKLHSRGRLRGFFGAAERILQEKCDALLMGNPGKLEKSPDQGLVALIEEYAKVMQALSPIYQKKVGDFQRHPATYHGMSGLSDSDAQDDQDLGKKPLK